MGIRWVFRMIGEDQKNTVGERADVVAKRLDPKGRTAEAERSASRATEP